MSKYLPLWQYLRSAEPNSITLTFKQIKDILGFEIDHSFLNCKKEAKEFGFIVKKISLKNETVIFVRI